MLRARAILWLAAILVAPSLAQAANHAPEPSSAEAPSATADAPSSESQSLGPIVGACVGVLFGGILAAWHIRGMKRDA